MEKTPLEVLKIIRDHFLDCHYPLDHVVLDPKKDMNYSVGNLVRDTITKAEKGESS